MPPVPRLTAPQERDLVIAAETGDHEARLRLVESFLPAITGLARGYPRGAGVEHRELVQEGVAGLLVAARRFDPRLSTPFWGYASYWVRKGMQELVAELARPVGLSDRAVRRLAVVRAARADHLGTHGSEPSSRELSRTTGLSRPQVERLLAAERPPRSIDEPSAPDGVTTLGERIADPAAERAFDAVLDRIELGEVRALAQRLDGRERTVILAHYGLAGPPRTLQEIGGTLGVTAERARQIEAKALEKLRTALADPHP